MGCARAAGLAIWTAAFVATGCSYRAYVPDRVTTDGLLAIKNGMTYPQVESLIGPPLCARDIQDSTLTSAARAMADDLTRDCYPMRRSTTTAVPPELRDVADLTLSYANANRSWTDLKIYIGFARGKIRSVYIKEDNMGICCQDYGQPTSPFYWIGSREHLRDLIGR
ncbi:MAG TPA: hypothetical protein VEU08_00505 [Vicinamibacterales bacterium]|nr:hypothetical protein [Vicinamibacterales bacterium]